MLEKLISRIYGLMTPEDPEYIFQIRIDIKHDKLIYKFVHYISIKKGIQDIKYKFDRCILDGFYNEVNRYLDELYVTNYKPRFKVGDVVSFGNKINDKTILAVINSKTDGAQYVIEFIDGGYTRLIPIFDIDNYHSLKE